MKTFDRHLYIFVRKISTLTHVDRRNTLPGALGPTTENKQEAFVEEVTVLRTVSKCAQRSVRLDFSY